MGEIIVAKAGGTSNATAEAVQASHAWAERSKVFVVSAPGKHPDGRDKITNRLLSAYEQYARSHRIERVLKDEVVERYSEIVSGLGLTALGRHWVDSIGHRLEQAVRYGEDETSMLGEQLQAEIYEALGFILLDPSTAPVDLAANEAVWQAWLGEVVDLSGDKRYVIPGNITRWAGKIGTFDRGGSDTTSGYVAYGVGADLNINLTDGPAQSADPRMGIFQTNPKRLYSIGHLLYQEGRELGRNGTGLVHPAAMIPLMKGNIPTEVRSTFDKELSPTILDNDTKRATERSGRAVALSLMEGVVILTIYEPGMAEALGRLATIESELARRGITLIDSQGYGVDAQRYFVDKADEQKARDIINAMLYSGGEVNASQEVSLITVVGYKLGSRLIDNLMGGIVIHAGIDFQKWQCEGHELTHGEHSIRLSVNPEQADEVFDRLHSHFIETR